MKLIYIANARIPSEKAHPFQIVQMCEAFAANSAEVTLLFPRRTNPPELRTNDIWAHYGVSQNFKVERLYCVDVYTLERFIPRRMRMLWEHFAALVVGITFMLALIPRMGREHNSIIYSRDPILLMLLAALWPKRTRRLFFEPHTFPTTGVGRRIRDWLARHTGGFIVITGHLAARYKAIGVPEERLMIAHDGFREARFSEAGDRAASRARIGWPQDAFIVGYMGRFQTLGMDKGLSDLADAVVMLARETTACPVHLGLVGGPDATVDSLRTKVQAAGINGVILYAGQVPAADVPRYLRAFDVCVMPFPWTEHFAYYASPMKLFEYMASGSAVVATDLPSTAEIVRHKENGLLVPPSDVQALAGALRRLRDDPEMRKQIAAAALADVQHYTWSARAKQIMEFIQDLQAGS